MSSRRCSVRRLFGVVRFRRHDCWCRRALAARGWWGRPAWRVDRPDRGVARSNAAVPAHGRASRWWPGSTASTVGRVRQPDAVDAHVAEDVQMGFAQVGATCSPAGEKSSVRNYRSNRSLTSRRSAAMSIEGNRESLNLEETQRVGPKPRAAKLSPHAGSNCFRRLSAPSPLSCGNVASRPVSNTRTAAIGP